MTALRTTNDQLSDLARGAPALFEAVHGRATGVTLTRFLGAGGMATVFLAELDQASRSDDLSPLSPHRLAIKFMQVSTERELSKLNLDPMDFFVRETVALGRVMERKPPTEFVVGFYGSGRVDVEVPGGRVRRLPWLAIEYVDGGAAGSSLAERVARTAEGIDPIRAVHLVRGIVEGVKALHGEGIIHRDLKPENVLVAGPIDDETPKLADCGIARVAGLGSTVAAMTAAYAGPEQALSLTGHRNPLIGVWTDVHALAAVVWFILGGEPWCVGDYDRMWAAGERRSLRTAQRLHAAFTMDERLLDRLEAVLRRGAAHRLPEGTWTKDAELAYGGHARARYPAMFGGVERFATIDLFEQALMPLLDELATRWTARAVKENRAATAFRPTQLLSISQISAGQPLAKITEVEVKSVAGAPSFREATPPTTPGSVVFQPDGRVLARFGERLFYFVEDEPRKVGVPPEWQAQVAASKWLVRGPGGGFALAGPSGVLLIRGGRFSAMAMPQAPNGVQVGEIQAVVGDGRVFGIVTAETDDSNGGAELWRSTDGAGWTGPSVLPLGGDVHAIACGPYGLLAVGSRRGTKGRALFIGLDDHTNVFTAGVNDKPALHVAVCGAARTSWAAGTGCVVRFDRGAAAPETIERSEMGGLGGERTPNLIDAGDPAAAVAMGLDVVGVPWLVTTHAVLRRHVDGTEAAWKTYYRRDASRPQLVAIGFTPDGARVLDARGNAVRIEPLDIDAWRGTALNAAS
jgi:eukaryotic-like serine/threonine-protein kinase